MLFDYKASVLTCLLLLVANDLHADKIHDPTAPPLSKKSNGAGIIGNNAEGAEPEIILQGIVNKKDTRMAIISGQLHRVGGMIYGYKISQVNKNNVVLTKSGSQKRLYVYE